MRLKPYGLYSPDGRTPLPICASDYSNSHYDGVRCGYDRHRNPVVIMCSKRNDPLPWKVEYGYSAVFFATFREALAFCTSRDMTLLAEYEDGDNG